MYAVSISAEGDCYVCVPPDPGIAAAALGASESATPGAGESAAPGARESAAPGTRASALSCTASAQVFHTFTLDSGASRSFFRDCTTLTPLSRPAAVSLADPSGGPVLAHYSTVLPCSAAPLGFLSSLYLPSFSTNLVSGADLQDGGVDQFTPASQRVTHCTCARTGRHLATFTRRPGSSLYTLTTKSPPAAASWSGPESAPCSCCLLSHQTLLWHHRLGHPSLPHLRGMASRVLVSGLPRSLPPLPPGPAPTCVPCVEGRQHAAPHSSEFPPTEAPLQTLHMDVWGPARVRGQGHKRYFLLVVDDYSRYTTVFPLRSKESVSARTFLFCVCTLAVPSTHQMALRPSSASQRVPLLSPPASSLPAVADPESDSLRAASPTVTRLLATAITDPSFESAPASALVAELVDFAAHCRLDYATSLVSESAFVCPPSVGSECALSTDVLEDRQEEFQCFAAALPHLVSTLLAPEGDPDAPDILTPRSYAKAIEGRYSSQWQAAVDAEMASWKSTGTYVDEVPLTGANIVSGMWIFRVKRPPASPPVFKARYVARGFSQRQGVDYFQTFSPTPKMTTLRVLLHVAAHHDYELHYLDFSTAFLQGNLHEEIWLRRPSGFTGRQREWHDTLWTTLAALGFAPSTADPSLFLRTDTSLPPFYILVYVDDLVFAMANTAGLAHVKSKLQKRHTCTDLGELRSYLGLQITRDRARRTITLTHSHMVQQVLQCFDFTYSSPQATPLSTRHSLSALPLDESVEPSGPYPELVGCLMYLMTCTRPNLAYPLSILARYVAPRRHRPEHMAAAKRVLRFLCSTSGMGLVLGGQSPVVLTGNADASWVDDLATQRSSQGYTLSLGSGSVSWRSTRSSSVLSSSNEAEVYAGAMAALELRWLTYLLTDLGEPPRSPPVLYVDNKAKLALCREHRLEHRTKHIALRYFLARELQQRGQLRLAYVASQANTADIFTKALQPCDHQRFFTMLACFDLLCLTCLVTPCSPHFAYGGLGDSLLGLASTFAVALIMRRAFIIRHPCIPFAFEPNLVDWTPSDDVPMEPAREIAMDRAVARVAAWEKLQAADEVPMMDLRNLFLFDLAFFFHPFHDAVNMRLSWNRGELTELLTEEQGPWGEWMRATGLRVPYSVGCILRLLLKPKPEVTELLASLWGQTHAAYTVSIGVHVRIQDETAWQGERKLRPKEYNSTELQELLEKAAPIIGCAQSVEAWWFPPPLRVRWVLITNSGQLKDTLKLQLPDKVLFTGFVPRHSEKLGDILLRERGFNHFAGNASDAVLLHDYEEAALREATAHGEDVAQMNHTRIHEAVLANLTAAGKLTGSVHRGEEGDGADEAERKSAAVMDFREMVAEWLLLSTCHSFVLPESGFSRSAALYSLRPMSIFFYQRCDPEAPEKLTDMASTWSRV
ncbi:unnamed protein product [Closterium sp. NIES-53]